MFDRSSVQLRQLGQLALWVVLPLALVSAPAEATGGEKLFTQHKCNLCHAVQSAGIEATIKSEKMKGPDLGGMAATRDAAWLGKYLRKETDIDSKPHPREFKGSDDDVKALFTWLSAQTRSE